MYLTDTQILTRQHMEFSLSFQRSQKRRLLSTRMERKSHKKMKWTKKNLEKCSSPSSKLTSILIASLCSEALMKSSKIEPNLFLER